MLYHTDNNKSNLDYIIAVYNGRAAFHKFNTESNSLAVGEPLTIDAAKGILKHVNLEELDHVPLEFKGIIPRNVLTYKNDFRTVTFTTPAMMQHLYFAPTLPMESRTYPIPALVWKVEGSKLDIFAIKSDENVTEETPLFQAPFLNVGCNGAVCMGSARIEEADNYEEFIEHVLHKFFNSQFTHTNTDKLATIGIHDMYSKQSTLNSEVFNTEILLPLNKTINDIL